MPELFQNAPLYYLFDKWNKALQKNFQTLRDVAYVREARLHEKREDARYNCGVQRAWLNLL